MKKENQPTFTSSNSMVSHTTARRCNKHYFMGRHHHGYMVTSNCGICFVFMELLCTNPLLLQCITFFGMHTSKLVCWLYTSKMAKKLRQCLKTCELVLKLRYPNKADNTLPTNCLPYNTMWSPREQGQ